MTWIEEISACFSKCCGDSDKEHDSFASQQLSSFQSTYTVRRISSFGQTVTDEKGEEREIGRHSSVVTYDGSSAPWSSKPAPIQPGVTFYDIKKQVDKMPPIKEYTKKQKSKQKWKKPGMISNKEISFTDLRKNKPEISENIQLKAIKYQADPNLEFEGKKRSEIPPKSSHENLFTKCTKKEDNKIGNYLDIPGSLIKSISTPDLVVGKNIVRVDERNFKDTGQLSHSTERKISRQSAIYNLEVKDSAAEKLAREYGLDLSMYTKEALNESIKCVTNSNVECWIEEPIGTLVLSIDFNTLQKMLNVTILSLPSLSGRGLKNENFATIIKLSLIGSKKYTKTSKRIEEEWRSAINQDFSFLIKDMDFRSLRILVYNADWLGKHDAIGYGFLSLQQLLEKTEHIQLKLYSQPHFGCDVGLMQITFGYDGIMFSITVDKIFNYDSKLTKWKVYTKITYYSLSKKVKERISNLVWSEKDINELSISHSAAFRVEPSGKKHSYIIITLKRGDGHGVFKSDQTLGRVSLGPSFYYQDGKQLTPWGLALIKRQKFTYSFKMFV